MRIQIELPQNFVDARLHGGDFFMANNSTDYSDRLKITLPPGTWEIKNIKDQVVTLGKNLFLESSIDYNSITTEDLEEYIEIIDWSMVPPELITEEIKESFGSMPQLKLRLWLEDLLLKLFMKEFPNEYPGTLFFYLRDECQMILRDEVMEYSIEFGRLIESEQEIFNNITYETLNSFLKNIMKIYFKSIGLKLYKIKLSNIDMKESYRSLEPPF